MKYSTFGSAPKKSAFVPEGGAPIVEAAKRCGYCVNFHAVVNKTDVETRYRVTVYKQGNSCVRRSIGRLDELLALTEKKLAAKITGKTKQ